MIAKILKVLKKILFIFIGICAVNGAWYLFIPHEYAYNHYFGYSGPLTNSSGETVEIEMDCEAFTYYNGLYYTGTLTVNDDTYTLSGKDTVPRSLLGRLLWDWEWAGTYPADPDDYTFYVVDSEYDTMFINRPKCGHDVELVIINDGVRYVWRK